MSTTARMLWLIESRFREKLTLDDLVAATGKSKSHLSRVFPLLTGYSITAYLRARRLTEAARLLADGAPDILSVALEAGYGSHEAFTRAFRDQFGITPESLRRLRDLDAIQLVEPFRMDTLAPNTIAPPRIDLLPRLHFAGLSQRHKMSHAGGIPGQWQLFQAYIGNVDGAVPGAAYGLVGYVAESADDFEYVVAMQIREDADLPPELTSITVPAQSYARLVHDGDVTSIRSTIHAGSEWLASEGRQLSDTNYGFFEYYGPQFDPATGTGSIEIWFALRP